MSDQPIDPPSIPIVPPAVEPPPSVNVDAMADAFIILTRSRSDDSETKYRR